MSDTKEIGPIYGVELLSTLPMDGGSMRQALPSRQDLDDVRKTHINGCDRMVAGFEVLTEHYRRAMDENESLAIKNVNLRKEVNALRAQLGIDRKYVEWIENKPTGGCPTSG